MTTPNRKLTKAQLDKAREALAAKGEAEDKALNDQVRFEAERDALAYEIIQRGRAEKPPRHIPLGEAQQLAAEQLKNPKKNPSPAVPLVEPPAA